MRLSATVTVYETVEIDFPLKITVGYGRPARCAAVSTIASLCRFETRSTAGFIRHVNKEIGVSDRQKELMSGRCFQLSEQKS
jgi:hypothetical protein